MVGRTDPTILVPVDVSTPEAPSSDQLALFHPLRVVVLGYYPVPDQASPEQLKEEYESEAIAQVEAVTEQLVGGGEVEGVVVFTRDREATVDRLVAEYDCDVVFSPGDADGVRKVLVPLKGDPNLERIVLFVADLLRENDATVTLYHAVTPDEDASQSEFILRGAADRLAEEGVERARIDWEQSATSSPANEIVALAEEHDLVVIGESAPSLQERILGDVPTRILDRTGQPVLVVRAPQ